MNNDFILKFDWGSQQPINQPTWSQITDALNVLNGSGRSQFFLSNTVKKDSIMVGGGKENKYIVSYFPDDTGAVSYQVSDPTLHGPVIKLVVSQPSEFPANWCIRKSIAEKVLQVYFQTGVADSSVQWEGNPDEPANP